MSQAWNPGNLKTDLLRHVSWLEKTIVVCSQHFLVELDVGLMVYRKSFCIRQSSVLILSFMPVGPMISKLKQMVHILYRGVRLVF